MSAQQTLLPSVGPVVTHQDREWAAMLVEAVRGGDLERVATILAWIHERAVMCASVRAERERERDALAQYQTKPKRRKNA